MKNRSATICLLLVVSSFLLTSCSSSRKASGKKYAITIINPSSVERADELIVLRREIIEQRTGKLGDGKYVSITTVGNEPVIVQFDDVNKDGKWDEAAFLYRFKPNEAVQLIVSQTTSRLNKAVLRAHV